MVGVSRGCLDFAAHQQRVLLGHQQLSIVGHGRPAAAVHQGIVHGDAAPIALVPHFIDVGRSEFAVVVFFQVGEQLRLSGNREAALGGAGDRHA